MLARTPKPRRITEIDDQTSPEEVQSILVELGAYVDADEMATAFILCRGNRHLDALASDVYFCGLSEADAVSTWRAGAMND